MRKFYTINTHFCVKIFSCPTYSVGLPIIYS
nr:MAG TPA: hypothetical protein [Caudoviricetes sp.]